MSTLFGFSILMLLAFGLGALSGITGMCFALLAVAKEGELCA